MITRALEDSEIKSIFENIEVRVVDNRVVHIFEVQ